MRTTLWCCALSLLGLCLGTGTSDADVIVRGPFGRTLVAVTPQPGPPAVLVQAPGVQVQVQQPPPPPSVLLQPPPPTPLPPGPIVGAPSIQLPPSVVLPARPMTHKEFAKVFQPLPGNYQVVLIHPGSHQPVTVCFTLPAGCPRVRVLHRDLVFDYGRHEVDIRFAIHGKVRVTTR